MIYNIYILIRSVTDSLKFCVTTFSLYLKASGKIWFELFCPYLASLSLKVNILSGWCLPLLPLPAGRKKLERQIGSCGHKSLLEKSIQTGSGSKTLHKLCRQSFIFTSVCLKAKQHKRIVKVKNMYSSFFLSIKLQSSDPILTTFAIGYLSYKVQQRINNVNYFCRHQNLFQNTTWKC